MQSLGKVLWNARQIMGLTLRQVEEATGISNAYLSQLENEKIKKPSADFLYKLASIYNVELNTLLIAAGIVKESSGNKNKLFTNAALSAEQLTEEEERQLLIYLKVLRQHKK